MPKRKLDRDYTYQGELYAAGDSVEVPEGWPEDVGEKVGGRPKKQDRQESESEE